MLARTQRIAAGIEIFALVFWVGGLFYEVAFLLPVAEHVLAGSPDDSWRVIATHLKQFGSVEIIFALIILASNFLKLVVFRGMAAIQRVALLVSAIMLIFAFTSTFVVQPRLEEKRGAVGTLVRPPTPEVPPSPERREFDELRSQLEILLFSNWVLGIFMVYAYRTFEERKLQALARIIKMP